MMQQERRRMDRRSKVASPFSHHRLTGRRRTLRRSGEDQAAAGHLDLYPRHFMAVAVSILLLCILDAHNTLRLLEMGAREVNPFMDVLIRQSPRLFVMCKFLLTGFGIILLMAYHNARTIIGIRARAALYMALLGYVVLIIYQWSMFPAGS
ncbi:MAG TPA: hypothetical protein ENI99_00775 [Sedimenticola sp.]|nr:hypothetical protein [Sedimenticola sp.]